MGAQSEECGVQLKYILYKMITTGNLTLQYNRTICDKLNDYSFQYQVCFLSSLKIIIRKNNAMWKYVQITCENKSGIFMKYI